MRRRKIEAVEPVYLGSAGPPLSQRAEGWEVSTDDGDFALSELAPGRWRCEVLSSAEGGTSEHESMGAALDAIINRREGRS